MSGLTPQQIVEELDKFVIGQKKAKRSVAIALRNRQRRQNLPEKLRDEVRPKNILMIGPTGVGKTEIARRLARLVNAPFIKIEATKFTEVGYVGRDVEAIIKDLVEVSLRMVKEEKTSTVQKKARLNAEHKLARILAGLEKNKKRDFGIPFMEILNDNAHARAQTDEQTMNGEVRLTEIEERLKRREMETEIVEIEVPDTSPVVPDLFGQAGLEDVGQSLQDFFSSMMPKRSKTRRMTVAEARETLTIQEAEKLLDWDELQKEAINKVEESGIVFLDEIDKIAGSGGSNSLDVSREGVQRDILPIVEGATVLTKYGAVRTDHILFIAAGAFHVSKPSDLIPEFQGRFPIRVELEALSAEDFARIMIEPENALIKQETALLASEGFTVEFTSDAIRAMAEMAYKLNEENENIGARRLYTILEQVLEDISFSAPEKSGENASITREFVLQRLKPIIQRTDLSRYIL